jgi:hypothetical protein
LAKFQSQRAITQPKITGLEQNVHLICNSLLHTHIPKINISKHSEIVQNYIGIFFCHLFFLCPSLKVAETYSVTHVRNSEIKQLLTLFFAILWDIDLIFGMLVYSDKLQIEFTFRSSPMIFGRVMALGLWNLTKYLVVTTFFRYAWRYWFLVYECVIMSYRSSVHTTVVRSNPTQVRCTRYNILQ